MTLTELSKEDRLRLVKFVCSFAWADLQIADSERRFVHKLVRKLKLDNEERRQVEEWLEIPPRAEELDPAEIPREHRELFLTTAREMIEADGEIAEEEVENFALFEQLLS
ncbi:MAG: TerB family tellurite resistance protein [Sandaracinaceae bacterium]|nr:TerB family tellurite resistance protein [Sandaracinaceae bacterium]